MGSEGELGRLVLTLSGGVYQHGNFAVRLALLNQVGMCQLRQVSA